jgi:hypothetical protein
MFSKELEYEQIIVCIPYVSLETLTIKDTCAGETYGLTKN